MRLRGILATLLAVLLLSVTAGASACEMSCGLKMAMSGCGHTASGYSLSSHSMQNMSRGNEAAAAKAHSTTSCAHIVCEHPPQALVNEQRSGAVQMLSLLQVVVLATLALPAHAHAFVHASETPPLRSSLLVFLQNTLRV